MSIEVEADDASNELLEIAVEVDEQLLYKAEFSTEEIEYSKSKNRNEFLGSGMDSTCEGLTIGKNMEHCEDTKESLKSEIYSTKECVCDSKLVYEDAHHLDMGKISLNNGIDVKKKESSSSNKLEKDNKDNESGKDKQHLAIGVCSTNGSVAECKVDDGGEQNVRNVENVGDKDIAPKNHVEHDQDEMSGNDKAVNNGEHVDQTAENDFDIKNEDAEAAGNNDEVDRSEVVTINKILEDDKAVEDKKNIRKQPVKTMLENANDAAEANEYLQGDSGLTLMVNKVDSDYKTIEYGKIVVKTENDMATRIGNFCSNKKSVEDGSDMDLMNEVVENVETLVENEIDLTNGILKTSKIIKNLVQPPKIMPNLKNEFIEDRKIVEEFMNNYSRIEVDTKNENVERRVKDENAGFETDSMNEIDKDNEVSEVVEERAGREMDAMNEDPEGSKRMDDSGCDKVEMNEVADSSKCVEDEQVLDRETDLADENTERNKISEIAEYSSEDVVDWIKERLGETKIVFDVGQQQANDLYLMKGQAEVDETIHESNEIKMDSRNATFVYDKGADNQRSAMVTLVKQQVDMNFPNETPQEKEIDVVGKNVTNIEQPVINGTYPSNRVDEDGIYGKTGEDGKNLNSSDHVRDVENPLEEGIISRGEHIEHEEVVECAVVNVSKQMEEDKTESTCQHVLPEISAERYVVAVESGNVYIDIDQQEETEIVSINQDIREESKVVAEPLIKDKDVTEPSKRKEKWKKKYPKKNFQAARYGKNFEKVMSWMNNPVVDDEMENGIDEVVVKKDCEKSWRNMNVENTTEEENRNKAKNLEIVPFGEVVKDGENDAEVIKAMKLAKELNMKGHQLLRNGNCVQAKIEYTKAIRLTESDPIRQAICYGNRAYCFLKMGEFRKAEQDCKKVLELDPTSPLIFAEPMIDREPFMYSGIFKMQAYEHCDYSDPECTLRKPRELTF